MSRSRMFGNDRPGPEEVPSPRTTIVGGRPPEAGAGLPPVPTGIQQLLRLAAIDAAFRARLVEGRASVAAAAGVQLTPNEQAVLRAAPAAQLELMIDSVPPAPADRREFLREAAASAVTLLGGASLVALGSACPVVRGSQADLPPPQGQSEPLPTRPTHSELKTGGGAAPDEPPSRPQHRETDTEGGAAPHQPPPRPQHRETVTLGGTAPDQPPERAQHRLQAPGGAAPDLPPPPSPTRGIRPDLPPPKKKPKDGKKPGEGA